MTLDLIAIGEVMVDVAAARLPAPGEREHAPVSLGAGGSPVNAALAAAASGARATVVGRVGDDGAAQLVRSTLERAGIVALLAEDDTAPTGICVALGPDTLIVDRGANARLEPSDLPARLAAGAVLVSGHVLLRSDTEAAGTAALSRAEGDWIAVDAAAPGLAADRFVALTTRANAVFANAAEARALTGLDAEAAARELGRRYRLACVKRGANGAIAVLDGELAETPSLARGPRLGDGDMFAGVLLAQLVAGGKLGDSLRAAAAA